MNSDYLKCRKGGARLADWQRVYEEEEVEKLPWYLDALDLDFEQEINAGKLKPGQLLDIGTGPGTQAEKLARLGFKVTGIDVSSAAVAMAQKRTGAVQFLQDNILETRLCAQFDSALDRGCFHVLSVDQRALYVAGVSKALKTGGLLFLKVMSTAEPERPFGPLRISKKEIKDVFESHFKILELRESEFAGATPYRPKALFAVLEKIPIRMHSTGPSFVPFH